MIYRRRICSKRTSSWSSFWRGWWRPPASPPKRGPLTYPMRSCGAIGSCIRCPRRMECTPWTTRSLEKAWKWRRRAAARALWMKREGWRASDCSSPAARQWGGESDIRTPKYCECTLSWTSWDFIYIIILSNYNTHSGGQNYLNTWQICNYDLFLTQNMI